MIIWDTNYRISELHAAVGLGQIKKMDDFIRIQRRNHGILMNALSTIPEVSFRRIPDPDGNSCGFLSFFMPTAELSAKVVDAFKEHGIDGYWNYFDNNWHYIRKWDHLKDIKSLFPLSKSIEAALQNAKDKKFQQSDDLISRNISCLIKLSWTEEEVRDRGARMVQAIKSIL